MYRGLVGVRSNNFDAQNPGPGCLRSSTSLLAAQGLKRARLARNPVAHARIATPPSPVSLTESGCGRKRMLKVRRMHFDSTFPSHRSGVTQIAELNDRLHHTLHGGRILASRGVAALGPSLCSRIVAALREFNKFRWDEDDPPR